MLKPTKVVKAAMDNGSSAPIMLEEKAKIVEKPTGVVQASWTMAAMHR